MRLLLLAPPLLAPAAAHAQAPVLWNHGDDPGDRFGTTVANCGDVDDDGYDDWIVGAPKANANGPNSGSAFVYSGLSGALLHRFDGGAAGIEFGTAVDGAGDVNGDGHADLIVGAPRASSGTLSSGETIVFSGADGSILHQIAGQTQFGFQGSAVAGVGDVDGDQRSDFLTASPYADTNGADSGHVALYSGATGALLREHLGDTGGAHFGASLAGGHDVNGDGRADYLIGAPADATNGTDAGLVRLFSGLDGTVLDFELGILGDRLGADVAFLGDLDGNGRTEYGWTAPDSGAGDGRIVVRNDDGSPRFTLLGAPDEHFGTSLAAAGATFGDARRCLAVGTSGAPGGGRVSLYDQAGSFVGDLAVPQDAGAFGADLAGGFDTNGDGRHELVVGDPRDSESATDAGRATLYSSAPLSGVPLCDGATGPCPCGNHAAADEGCANSTGVGAHLETTGTASVSGDALCFHATALRANTPAVLFSAVNALDAANGVPFKDGLLCASGQSLRHGVQFADASGAAAWGPGLATSEGFAAGTTRIFQVWYRDPGGVGPCGSGSNTSLAVSVAFSQ